MSINEFFKELDDAARKRLEPAYASELRIEISTHLEAEIQARLELGEAQDRAEEEALRALGTVDQLVTAASRRHGRRSVIDPKVLVAVTVAHINLAVLVGYGSGIEKWPLGFHILIPATLIASALWIALVAYRARVLQWAISVLLLLPLTVVYSMSMAITSAAPYEFFSYGSMPYSQLPEMINAAQVRAQKATAGETAFNLALEERVLKAANGTLSQEEALLGPRWKPFDRAYDLHTFKSKDEALKAWLKVTPQANFSYNAERGAALEWMFQLSEQQARPYWKQVVFHLPQGALISGWLSLFTFGIVTFSWLLRRLIEALRGRWRMRSA